MDGMADYMRTPSRMMFPDVADLEAASSFLNSEKARSLGLHHLHHPHLNHHPFGSALHPPPRIPNTIPLAAIQQHLYTMQQQQQQNRNNFPMPSPSSSSASPSPSGGGGGGGNNVVPPLPLAAQPTAFPTVPIPFPHHLLSQWTMAAAAGFGLFGLGLPSINNLQQTTPCTANGSGSGGDQSPPHSSSSNSNKLINSSLSPVSHRFSPYPTLIGSNKTAPANLNLSSASSDPPSTPPQVDPSVSSISPSP